MSEKKSISIEEANLTDSSFMHRMMRVRVHRTTAKAGIMYMLAKGHLDSLNIDTIPAKEYLAGIRKYVSTYGSSDASYHMTVFEDYAVPAEKLMQKYWKP